MRERYDADERSRRRNHEENRPKNAGVHADQLKKASTKSNRRKAKQKGYSHE